MNRAGKADRGDCRSVTRGLLCVRVPKDTTLLHTVITDHLNGLTFQIYLHVLNNTDSLLSLGI